MQIMIEYDSIWQNSFLSGDDNKPISSNNKRKFIATTKSKNYVGKPIGKETVLGVLCRLIGDQRKLYQAKNSQDYYFRDIESLITYNIEEEYKTEEKVFIINKSDKRPAQSAFIGIIPDDTELFFSASAQQLWSVIYLDITGILDFIYNGSVCRHKGSSMPRDLLFRIDEISNTKAESGKPIIIIEKEIKQLTEQIIREEDKKLKLINKFQENLNPNKKQKESFKKSCDKIISNISELNKKMAVTRSKERREFEIKMNNAVDVLSKKYPNLSYLENGTLYKIRLYAAALYLQAERMNSNHISVDYCLNRNGETIIQGFSKRGFNGVRDFLSPLAGSKKKTVGTPFPLTKASGQLSINIDIDRNKAKDLKRMIENAGVSSFYLGKKGLAYVTNIDTRELRSG